jgi:hypothetical protein
MWKPSNLSSQRSSISEATVISNDRVHFDDKQYVRRTELFSIPLQVETLSRSTEISHDETHEQLIGYATATVGSGRRIAMMDAPEAPAEKFKFWLTSGRSSQWDISEEAKGNWPAQVSCTLDANMKRRTPVGSPAGQSPQVTLGMAGAFSR